MELGFLLDASGSMKASFQDAKQFVQSVAGVFSICRTRSRVGVITFSKEAEYNIKLKDHSNVMSFNLAVDAIPLMGSVTRIDKALALAQKEIFTISNGARVDLPKILILITNGKQTQHEDTKDPVTLADELRKAGIIIIVVGFGTGINREELSKIAGGTEGVSDMLFTSASLTALHDTTFIKSVQDKACSGM